MFFDLHHSKKQFHQPLVSEKYAEFSRRQHAKETLKKLGSKVKHSFKKILCCSSKSNKDEPDQNYHHKFNGRSYATQRAADLHVIQQPFLQFTPPCSAEDDHHSIISFNVSDIISVSTKIEEGSTNQPESSFQKATGDHPIKEARGFQSEVSSKLQGAPASNMSCELSHEGAKQATSETSPRKSSSSHSSSSPASCPGTNDKPPSLPEQENTTSEVNNSDSQGIILDSVDFYDHFDLPKTDQELSPSVKLLLSVSYSIEKMLTANTQKVRASLKTLSPSGVHLEPLEHSREKLESIFETFAKEANCLEYVDPLETVPLIIWQFEEAYSALNSIVSLCSFQWDAYESSVNEKQLEYSTRSFFQGSESSVTSLRTFVKEVHSKSQAGGLGSANPEQTEQISALTDEEKLENATVGLQLLFVMLDGNAKIMRDNNGRITCTGQRMGDSELKQLRYQEDSLEPVWDIVKEFISALNLTQARKDDFSRLQEHYKNAYSRIHEIRNHLFNPWRDSRVISVEAKKLIFDFTSLSEKLSNDLKNYRFTLIQAQHAARAKTQFSSAA